MRSVLDFDKASGWPKAKGCEGWPVCSEFAIMVGSLFYLQSVAFELASSGGSKDLDANAVELPSLEPKATPEVYASQDHFAS